MTMPQLMGILLGLTLTASSFAAELQSAIDRDYSSLEALYRQLHAHPELSSHEVETAKIMAQQARDAGFTVTEHVGGTGVVALMKNGAADSLRSDMAWCRRSRHICQDHGQEFAAWSAFVEMGRRMPNRPSRWAS